MDVWFLQPFWTLLFFFAAIPAVGAQESGELVKCVDSGKAARGSMSAIFECYRAEFIRKEVILNDTYQSLRKAVDPVQRRELQNLERRWITARDRKCMAQANQEGGVEYDDGKLLWYGCQVRETERRITWLKNYGAKRPRRMRS